MSGLAETFRSLHRRGDPLRLLNAWDGAGARVFEAAGAPAIATTSAGLSFSQGTCDGESIARDQVVANAALIASTVSVPVSVDIESGYGRTPADVAETVRKVIAAGAVGINIEDAIGGGTRGSRPSKELRPIKESCERVHAARIAADGEGVRLFVNARTDTYLVGGEPDELLLQTALKRLTSFASSGADGVFVPGVTDSSAIAALVRGVDLPFNALAAPGALSVEDFAALGVARVSTGSVPSRATLGLARDIAAEFLADGTLESAARSISYGEINKLLAD